MKNVQFLCVQQVILCMTLKNLENPLMCGLMPPVDDVYGMIVIYHEKSAEGILFWKLTGCSRLIL